MDEQKKQLVEKLRSSMNILVTVRNNPTVDQLSACIALTLILNKMGKHASAVFSGEIPSTIEFLQPEDTLERNTNSLRDFIIALDKSKADKLRYKVEDKVVRIFITPYKTSISADDLDFSQGDFNVDSVVALGAHEQGELDQAITEHGRILHDAVVMSINNANEGNLGSINWQDNSASSLCELVLELSRSLSDKGTKKVLDRQTATALLTGIVAETDRFSNDKTTAETMNASAELMEAGANQQLVATKLEEAMEIPASVNHDNATDGEANQNGADEQKKPDDGTLEIDHEAARDENQEGPSQDHPQPEAMDNTAPDRAPDTAMLSPQVNEPAMPNQDQPQPETKLPEIKQLHPHDSMLPPVLDVPPAEVGDITGVNFMAERPSGSPAAAESQREPFNPSAEPLSKPHTPALDQTMLNHNGPAASRDDQPKPAEAPQPVSQPQAAEPPKAEAPELNKPQTPNPSFTPYTPPSYNYDQPKAAAEPSTPPTGQTLSEIEQSVKSSHTPQPASPTGPTDIEAARSEVLRALQDSPQQPEPIAALGAQPLGGELHPQPAANDIRIDQDGTINMPPPVNAPPVAPQPPQAPTPAAQTMINPPAAMGMPPASPTPPPLNPMGSESAPNPMSPADRPMDMPLPPSLTMPPPQMQPPTTPPGMPGTPPPVPPPMFPGQ